MQVSVQNLSKVERCLTVIVPSQRVEKAFDTHLVTFAKKVDVKGFRPGKVPLDYVKQRFAQEVRNEALNTIIYDTLNEAIQQEKLYPINSPRIETKLTIPGKDLEYTAIFDVLPVIDAIHFKIEQLDKLTAVITEADIDETIERVREQNAGWLKVNRPAQEKDMVKSKIQMLGEENKPLMSESMSLEFVLKDQASIFGWNLIEKLQGIQPGEERSFNHILPQENFMQGTMDKTLIFKIEALEVLELQLPALDEGFVKKLGIESGSLQDLRAETRKQLELNLKRTVRNLFKDKVFEKLKEQNPLELPRSLIEREAKHLHDETCSMNHENHRYHNHSQEDEKYFSEYAEKRIHLGLLIEEVVRQHKIKTTAERIDVYLAELASLYDHADKYIQQIKSDKNKIKEIESWVLEDMIVEKLIENVSVVEKEIGYQQLINQGAAS